MVSCPAPQTYPQHVLAEGVGDGRNTDDLQVTQVTVTPCVSRQPMHNSYTQFSRLSRTWAAADSTACHSSVFHPPQTTPVMCNKL